MCAAIKSAKALSFAGLEKASKNKTRMANSPAQLGPQTEAVEIEVDDWRGVEGQHLTDKQAADDRNAEGPTQFGAFAEPDRQRQRPEHRRHRRHHDRPEAFEAGLIDRLARG